MVNKFKVIGQGYTAIIDTLTSKETLNFNQLLNIFGFLKSLSLFGFE